MTALRAFVWLLAVAVAPAVAAPRLTSVTPGCAAPGAEITVTGKGLRRVGIEIGGVRAVVIAQSRRQVKFLMPGAVPSGAAQVTLVQQGRRTTGATIAVKGPEVCDGVDNDCDGTIDNGLADVLVGRRGGSGEPVMLRCRDGQLLRDGTDSPTGPESCTPDTIEACYDGPPETRGVGLCRDGARICGRDGTFGACQGQVLPGDEDPGNGIDENCDGRDGPGGGELCVPGALQACYSGPPRTRGVGPCRAGVRACAQSGFYGPCEDEVLPATEIPENGIDENCDGVDVVVAQQLELTVDPTQTPTFQPSVVISGQVGSNLIPVTDQGAALAVSIAPTLGHQGETLDVTVTASAGTFVANLASAAFGTGVTVNGVTVLTPTSLKANVTVDELATIGPRVVAVSSGGHEAIASNAFNVDAGLGGLKGRILDGDGNAVAGAQVCIGGTQLCVTTGADGTFELPDVPTTGTRLLVKKAGFDAINIPFSVAIGGTAVLGDVSFAPPSEPPPPPPPASPVVSAAVASALGRGASDIREGGKRVVLEKLVRDTIVGLGDKDVGVLDADGNQLNGKVTGNGLVSLENEGVEDMAFELASTATTTLGDTLLRLLSSYDYGNGSVPRVAELITGLQSMVNQAWADPDNAPASKLWFILFNQGRVPSEAPPVLSVDTPLNSLQSWLLIASWFSFEKNARAGTIEAPAQPLVQPSTTGRSLRARDALPPPAVTDRSALAFGWSEIFKAQSTDMGLKFASGQIKQSCDNLAPQLNGVKPPTCGNKKLDINEQCDASAGMPACDANCRSLLIPQAPTTCKNFADVFNELAKFGVKGGKAALDVVADRQAAFFKPEFIKYVYVTDGKLSPSVLRARAETASQRLSKFYATQSFQDAYTQSKKAALQTAAAQGLANLVKIYATDYLNKVQGAVIDTMTSLLVDAAIRSMRPQPPIITKVAQERDDLGVGLNSVKIEFLRSPNDDLEKQQQVLFNDPGAFGEQHAETWWYRLWREQNGTLTLATSGQVRRSGPGPSPTGDPRRLVFHDAPGPGTTIYRIEAKRLIGDIPFENVEDQPSFLNNLLAGFFSATVDPSKVVPARIGTFGLSSITPALTPVASIMRGIKLQSSPPSDPGVVYVDLGPPIPLPPFQLATSKVTSTVYLSNPRTGSIQRFVGSSISKLADAGFASSDSGTQQAGLAVDYAGAVYADNSASDTRFGGRVFRYASATGERSFVGSVNYFSQLLSYARPVGVLSMASGPGPAGESLYIADSVNQRITTLTINVPFDRSRNTSQPIGTFPFAGPSSIAVRYDGKLAATRFDEVYTFERFFNLNEATVENVPRSLFGPAAPTPFSAVSGVDYDTLGNMYVSDSIKGLVMMIPPVEQTEGLAFGQMTEAQKSRYIIARGFPGATDVHVQGDHRGVAFYDQSGVQIISFGISGQVTTPSGDPVAGAQVTIPDLHRVAVTDANGVYTMPGILGDTTARVLDMVIRFEGKTQNMQVTVEAIGHTIRDIVFNPVAPVDAGAGSQFTTVPSQPGPPVSITLARGAAAVADVVLQIPKVVPAGGGVNPPKPPFAVRLVTPIDGTLTPDKSTVVRGRMNRAGTNDGRLMVNGQDRGPVQFVDGVFEQTISGLTEGLNAIQVKSYEPGPAGDVGKATEDFENTLEGTVGAVENGVGDLLGLVSGAAGESIATVGDVAGRSPNPEAAAQANNAVGAAADMLARLQQGMLPTPDQAAALDQAARAAANAQGTSSRRLGSLPSRALGSGGFGKVAQEAVSKILGATQQSTLAASVLQPLTNTLGNLLTDITAQLGTTPLPPAVVTQITAAATAVSQTQGALASLDVGMAVAKTTEASQLLQQLQATLPTLTTAQQNLLGNFAAQLGTTTTSMQQNVQTTAQNFAETTGAVARVRGGSGGGLGALTGLVAPIVENVLGTNLSPTLNGLLGQLDVSMQGVQAILKTGSGAVSAAGADLAAKVAAAHDEAMVQSGGGGFLGSVAHGLAGVIDKIGTDTVGRTNALGGIAQSATAALDNVLGNITIKADQVDAMPAADQPPTWGGFGGALRNIAQVAQTSLDNLQLPNLVNTADLLRLGNLANKVLSTLTEPSNVVVDSTATATKFITEPGPEDPVEDASAEGEAVDGAQPAAASGAASLTGRLDKVVDGAVVLRIVDSDTGLPVGGSGFGIAGLLNKVVTDSFGMATLKFDPAVFQKMSDGMRGLLDQAIAALSVSTATVSTSTDAAEQKAELTKIIDSLSDLFGRIPTGLAQAPEVKGAFGSLIQGATTALQGIDLGDAIDPAAIEALGTGLQGIQAQIDDLLNNIRGNLQLDANPDQQVTITVAP